LLRALALRDDDPVSREVWAARERALQAALQSVAGDPSPAADAVRQNLTAHLTYDQANANEETTTRAARSQIYRNAIQAARRIVLAMRSNNEIGDDAFHRVEEELDWLEVGAGDSRQ
jgi:monovalent cation/hydrogen antiporter